MQVSPLGWLYLVFTTLWLPWAAVRSARKIHAAARRPSRAQHLTSVAVTQGGFLVLALAVARTDWVFLFPVPRFRPLDLALGVAFLVPTLGTLPLRMRWKPEPERWRNLWMYPQSPRDLGWWCAVALTAGVVEEIVFRGVMFTLWSRVVGSWWVATAICSVAFALAHFVQGWRAVAVIIVFTAAIHGIVWTTGNLYTAMVIHFVYDLLAGAIILRLARRAGVLPITAPPPSAELPGTPLPAEE